VVASLSPAVIVLTHLSGAAPNVIAEEIAGVFL
jgi:hypothetical protein